MIPSHQSATQRLADGQLRVLLVEDDDGDALLVEELLLEAAAPVTVRRVRSLAEAKHVLPGQTCVLLDLGLPDSHGLHGLHLLLELEPYAAVVVLTGLDDEHLGAAAVRAGAQDYLIKGQVDGSLLHRVIRYAVERRHADEVQRQLLQAQIYARENSRLERGLLPSAVLADPRLTVAARYRPGGQQMLLGGDFYDIVEVKDGWVHAMIGDVCGRGADEAALGVCLRVAWRTMVLAGRTTTETLAAVQEVLEHERPDDRLFTTVCTLSVSPDRTRGRLHLAGHPAPLLITAGGVRELTAPVLLPPGIWHTQEWPGSEVELDGAWSVLMYTDGLIEGRTGTGPDRLGADGLIGIIERSLAESPVAEAVGLRSRNEALLDQVIIQVRDLNGGDLDDDLAVFALGYQPSEN